MVGRNAWLDGGENKNLAVARDLKNGPAAVAYVKVFCAVKRNSRGHPHTFGIGGHGSIRRDLIYGAVKTRGNVHLALAVEGNRSCVHHLRDEWLHVVVGI